MKILSRSFLGKDTYITYPHTNAFAGGGRALVYARVRDGVLGLDWHDMARGTTSPLQEIAPTTEVGAVWYDVALQAPRLAAVFRNRAWILDLENPGNWICAYQAPPPATLDGLCSLSQDGHRLLCRESNGGIHRAIEIDLKSGAVRELFSKSWYANHFHYCPHDESWVAFSHEGATETIPDRCWVWHAEQAPQGRVAFDQQSGEPGKPLCVGHERWGFHDVSAYVPAYAVSPAGKRGLYEIFGDGRPAKLLWENDVLWHCTMDPTGRFVAVDTTGPFREERFTEEEFQRHLKKHLETDRNKGRNVSDVAIIDLKTRRTLHVAAVERHRHPYHPHPAISPDLCWLAWNEGRPQNRGAWLAAVSLKE